MKYWKLIMIMLLVIVILSAANPGEETVGFDNEVIVLKKLKGEVQYKSQGWWIFTGKWKTVEDQVELNQGDHIKTGNSGRADLFYLNEARILIEENSRVQIKENKRDDLQVKKLKLDEGSVLVDFMQNIREKMSFEVETPTAVAGVRGTLFKVEVDEGKETVVSVKEGKVSVSNDKTTVKVKGGENAVVRERSKKPEIGSFKQNEIKKWQQNSSILKETEKKSEMIREELKEKMKKDDSENQNGEDKSDKKENKSDSNEKKSDNKPEESTPESQQSNENPSNENSAANKGTPD
ncbi:MAG: FecR domain-containing protein [Halanaerobiaceae bacterium]